MQGQDPKVENKDLERLRAIRALAQLIMVVVLFLQATVDRQQVSVMWLPWWEAVPLYGLIGLTTFVLWISAKNNLSIKHQLVRPLLALGGLMLFLVSRFEVWAISMACILMFSAFLDQDGRRSDSYHVSLVLSICLFLACSLEAGLALRVGEFNPPLVIAVAASYLHFAIVSAVQIGLVTDKPPTKSK